MDQYVEIHRLIRSGMTYGALITVRMFLERWTLNLAASNDLQKCDDELDEKFITRVWSHLGPLVVRDMGADWAWISESLHGRRPFDSVAKDFDAAHNFGSASNSTKQLEERVLAIARATATQLLAGIEFEAHSRRQEGCISILPMQQHIVLPTLHRNQEDLMELGHTTEPLDPATAFSSNADRIIEYGAAYRRSINGRQAQNVVCRMVIPYHLVGALLERRARSIEQARRGLINEAGIIDPEDGHGFLYARLFRYGAISEAAFLVADEGNEYESAALRTAAMALHSSWQLWLDDTDITLGCLRGVIEQTARARTHRLKPGPAAKHESRKSSPNRWIEAAGLGRLNAIGRALGEFSHLKITTKRNTAREILVDVQPDGEPSPSHTARLHVLDSAAYLLAREVAERLEAGYPNLAGSFRRYVALMDEDGHNKFETDFLERSLKQKARAWGQSDYVGL
ncbi:hypothetical protein [Arthrobacter sp. UYCu511]|uniref:hypothetical protein n=1 Tax=Arthrobacter sp. UYCu511 TaxID=3156337 RepID=UPI00339A996E